MPEWVIERGIGETRAALLVGERILGSRVLLDGVLPAGSVVEARLLSIGQGGRNAVAALEDGTELLLRQRPAGVTEGQQLKVEIVRETIAGPEPWKRALAKPTDAPLGITNLSGRPAERGELDRAGWTDLLDEAATGFIAFSGGTLQLYVTPAMALFDVDGTLPSAELAIAGAQAAAAAARRLGIGGSIGIDLPNSGSKAARTAAAEAVDAALAGTPFERTAVNGFGFVQIVRPRRYASLPELYLGDRPAAEARALLRRAENHVGGLCLAAHPAVTGALQAHSEWLEALARRVGGAVTLRADPRLAMSAGHAEPL